MHLGVVKNKEEKIVGILTLDDILEEILGKIEDEYEHKKISLFLTDFFKLYLLYRKKANTMI